METKPRPVIQNFEKEQFYRKVTTDFLKSKTKTKFIK
jgi:hypothetical protein